MREDSGMRPATTVLVGEVGRVHRNHEVVGTAEISVQRRPRVADLEARIAELEAELLKLRRRLAPHEVANGS